MSRHGKIQELLIDLDALPAKQAREVNVHLQICAACATLAADYQRDYALIRQIPLPQPPPGLRYAITDRIRHHRPSRFRRLSLPRLSAPTVAWIGALLFAIVALTVGTIHPLSQGAGSGVTNLGKPTNDVPTTANGTLYLGAFYRIPPPPFRSRTAHVVFIYGDASIDSGSAAETWPLVKALQQFGSLSGVKPVDVHQCWEAPAQATPSGPVPAHQLCIGNASFDLVHARYHSRYVTLVKRDIFRGPSGQPYQTRPYQGLSGFLKQLYDHYALTKSVGRCPPGYQCCKTACRTLESGKLPLLLVGRYLQAGVSVNTPGFYHNQYASSLRFRTIQRAFQTNDRRHEAPLVYGMNAETNLVTALICHADHLQPSSVCTRRAIRTILKHVK